MNRKIPYTTAEDIAIVQYLLNNFKNPKLGGINVWIEMESNLKINHSWQSLKERFRKVIIREIDNNEKYKITKCQASALKKMITPKYRSSNIRSNIQYSQRMRESKTPQQETNLNDSVINNNNCRISDRTDSVPTWTTPTPGTSNNYTNLNNSVQEIQEHQSIIEISSDEEDVVMGHTTQQNKQSNTSICSKESIIFRIQEIQETAEKRVVPGRSSDNTSNLVCESHKNLSDCVYCFFYNHIKPSGNLKPDFTQVSEICNDLNSSISNNKPINNGENNTTTSKKLKNNDTSLCTGKNNEAGEMVTVSEICNDQNSIINNNKRINNGENNMTTSKKLKNNDKSLCTDKNNEAGETVTVQRKDSSLLGSNISDFRDDYDSGCETINYKPFQFICLVCTTRNNFFDVVSKTETKRKFEKNCNQCRSLFKLSYSNDQITSIRLLSNSQSNVNSSD